MSSSPGSLSRESNRFRDSLILLVEADLGWDVLRPSVAHLSLLISMFKLRMFCFTLKRIAGSGFATPDLIFLSSDASK